MGTVRFCFIPTKLCALVAVLVLEGQFEDEDDDENEEDSVSRVFMRR